MVKYVLGKGPENRVYVNGKSVFYGVELDLPDDVREKVSHELVTATIGRKLMGFYNHPEIGHAINHNGFRWIITGIEHAPVQYRKHGERTAPLCLTEYVGLSTYPMG